MRLTLSPICVTLALVLSVSCASTSVPKINEDQALTQKDREKQDSKPKSTKTRSKADEKLLEQANQYARDGLLREALQTLGDYLERNPNDPTAHRTAGILLVKTGSYKKAGQHLSLAFASYPNNYEVNFYMGEAMRMQNRFADGIYHYKRALEIEPKNTNSLKALAWSYYNIRYYSEAMRTARQLRRLAPNDFQVSIILARILNKIDMNDKALSILNRSETLTTPENIPFLNSVKGDILLSMGDKQAAELAYRKALQDQPLLPGALIGLARKIIEDKTPNNDIAITYLDRALKIRPSLIEAYYLLGKAYQKTKPSKALEYYRIFSKEAMYDPIFQTELAEIKPQLMDAARKVTNTNKRSDSVSREDGEEQL